MGWAEKDISSGLQRVVGDMNESRSQERATRR